MNRERRAILGGGLVALNHVIGAVVTVASALLLSKALGPNEFAIYAMCTSLSVVQRIVSRLGLSTYLLAQKEEPEEADYAVALGTMLGLSLLVAGLTALSLKAIGHFSHVPNLFWPGLAMTALLPLHILSLPATVKLERQLNYKPVLLIELAVQVLGQVTGICLAFAGWGVWGPVSGAVLRALVQSVAPWLVVGLVPQVRWHAARAWRMVKYGFGFVVTTSLTQSRSLILLSIMGRVAGPEAVGYMGLTLRAVGLIEPFRAAASRVTLPALAPIAHLPAALRRGVTAAVETELFLNIPVTVVAVLLFPTAVRLLLGPAWQPAATLFPWVAASSLLLSAHAASLSALHIRGFFAESIAAAVVGCFALAGALIVMGGLGGAEGCAAATVVAWPAAWLHEWFATRRMGTRWSRPGVAWALSGAAACLIWRLGPGVLALLALVGFATRARIKERARSLRRILS